MNNKKIMVDGLTVMKIEVSEEAISRLYLYLDELIKWNRKINLVAKAPVELIIETHFLDSLTLLPLLTACPPPGLLDIGSGAGFPGLPLKIVRPDLEVTLVEPRQKRVSFLKHIIRTLKLKGIKVSDERVEKGNNINGQGNFPIITSRAFNSISQFLALTAGLSAPQGRVICMKGPKAPEEIKEWQHNTPDSPYRLTEIIEAPLPFSKQTRNLVIFSHN
ncbi:MAG: 16S rRNA (guanine(527)-N(7))-methyltransferase RsmG [Proteobacteria bacterium]|nr:16S rRNA (guanine(527)-N(7))-methyltransferase RsmG [Pseudomonadota bacterium]